MTERLFLGNAPVVGFGDTSVSSPDPRELPSGRSAIDLVDGKPGAFWQTCAHTVGRAGLIGLGLYAAGDRERVWLHALGGSLAIETFVLGWVLVRRGAQK
jgi:hypothetical protein